MFNLRSKVKHCQVITLSYGPFGTFEIRLPLLYLLKLKKKSSLATALGGTAVAGAVGSVVAYNGADADEKLTEEQQSKLRSISF